MKQLLTDILNRLKTDVNGIKYVDEDWGQLDYYSLNPPVQFPAAIVDCINATFTNEGNRVQLGDVNILIQLADIKLTNTSGRAPSTQRNQAFAIYDIIDDIQVKLHGWTKDASAAYTPLVRTSLRRIKRQDGMRVHEIIYTTRIQDDKAKPTNEHHAVTLRPIVSFTDA